MTLLRSGIILPPLFQRRLEAAATKLISPASGPPVDFAIPPGEAALMDPDSVAWRVFKNPLALFVGGVAAVILELAEPRVRTGIWEHTSFRQDPLTRLQRTGLAAMMTVFGPRSRTEVMISAIRRRHADVNGLTPLGQAYRADDPELLNWVHATASFGFLEAYNAYVHALADAERDQFYAEGKGSSRLYGACGAPTSQRELGLLFESMRDKLEPSAIVFEYLEIMRRVPILPARLAPLQGWLVKAAIELMPGWVRKRLQLDQHWDLRPWQRALIKCGGAIADRVLLRSCPAVQACRRLGLADDYLYRRRS